MISARETDRRHRNGVQIAVMALPGPSGDSVPGVHVRIGATEFDLARRPLVVVDGALESTDDHLDAAHLSSVAKNAVAHGADLVIVPSQALSLQVTEAFADVGIGCVAEVVDAAGAVSCAENGATMVVWGGPDAPPCDLGVCTLVRGASGAESWACDGIVVAPDRLELVRDRPEGSIALVDLGSVTDRAELAALVVVALEAGVDGFVTFSPRSVRRAAYVIRAVEHAR